MSQVREAVLRKIRALRQMTVEHGCTEHEAALAAETLARLMAEHEVSQDELMLKRDAKGCIADVLRVIRPVRPEWFACAVPTAKLFKCQCWSSQRTEDVLGLGIVDKVQNIHFYGFPEDVEASLALMDIICHAVTTEATAFAKSGAKRGRGAAHSFELGMVGRLCERIKELGAAPRATGTALVVLKNQLVNAEFAQYCQDHGMNLRTVRRNKAVANPEAYAHGREAGDRVNLRPGPAVGGQRYLGGQG